MTTVSAPSARAPAKILVVDDRPTNRQFLSTLLGYGGHRLLEAGDGTAALTLARSEQPDLVITDLAMPGMDGYQLIHALRSEARFAATRVIVLTASDLEAEARALTRACGVSEYLRKPVDPAEMLRAVDVALVESPPAVAQGAALDRYVVDMHFRRMAENLRPRAKAVQAASDSLEGRVAAMTEAISAHLEGLPPRAQAAGREEDETRFDPLTRLSNRRHLDELLESELAREKRGGVPLGAMMIAIDGLARVRESFGNVIGDAVLVAVADGLRSLASAEDVLCRVGAGEFALLIMNAEPELVRARAAAAHDCVSRLQVEGAGLRVGDLRLSVGIAWDNGRSTDADPIEVAREALRNAVTQGGRRTVEMSRDHGLTVRHVVDPARRAILLD